MMRYRRLGRTRIDVSEVGFGGWGIGGATPGATSYGRTEDAVSLEALTRALDLGINFFDTSSVYGHGHSEKLIGRAIRGRRDQAVIATKAGLARYGERADFSPKHILSSLEQSLQRLGTDHVDLLQLHNPSPQLMEEDDRLVATAERLKRDGKICSFGVSVRTPEDGFIALRRMQPDVIQTNLNLMDHRAVTGGLLDAASAAGCGVIARTPLCFGFLASDIDEDTVFAGDDHRSRWPRHQLARWARGGRAVRDLAALEGRGTPGQFALRFCLSFSAVCCAIPGMLTGREVEENAAAATLAPLDAAMLREIEELYAHLDTAVEKPADPGKIDRTMANS